MILQCLEYVTNKTPITPIWIYCYLSIFGIYINTSNLNLFIQYIKSMNYKIINEFY